MRKELLLDKNGMLHICTKADPAFDSVLEEERELFALELYKYGTTKNNY